VKKPVKSKKSESEYLELKGFLSFLILHELSNQKLCGDELAKKIGMRKDGELTPGTIYPALKRLRRKKLISYARKGRRKVYSLSELGEKELKHLYVLFSRYFYGLKNRIRRRTALKTRKKKK